MKTAITVNVFMNNHKETWPLMFNKRLFLTARDMLFGDDHYTIIELGTDYNNSSITPYNIKETLEELEKKLND